MDCIAWPNFSEEQSTAHKSPEQKDFTSTANKTEDQSLSYSVFEGQL